MDQKEIKVLVVDDAAFMIKSITALLEADPDITVIGTAKNGQEGLEKIKELKPDVVTLDIDMPVMDGIKAIRHIMIESPVPIVVLSSLFNDGYITFEALRLGVVDFVPKPSGAVSRDIDKSSRKIIDRIKIANAVAKQNIRRVRLDTRRFEQSREGRYKYKHLDYLVAVGTTLSGPNTFIRMITNLSPQLPAAVVIVMDIAPQLMEAFVKRFDELSNWRIEAAKDKTVLEQGTCYILSNEHSLQFVENDQGLPALKVEDKIETPLNKLFHSAATVFKQNAIGLLLTGIGDDGAAGFSTIHGQAGVTIAQSTDTCVYPNLTQNAIENGVVDIVAEEREIPAKIEMLMR